VLAVINEIIGKLFVGVDTGVDTEVEFVAVDVVASVV
jgi:hypothetical protein